MNRNVIEMQMRCQREIDKSQEEKRGGVLPSTGASSEEESAPLWRESAWYVARRSARGEASEVTLRVAQL
jgi:hypothetical protein